MIDKLSTITQKLSPSLLKTIDNTAWLLADRVLRMGIGLLVGVWVARYLGPEEFGFYNYAIAFASIFNTVANLGLDSIVVRNIVSQPSSKDEVLGTAFILKMIAQVVALGLGVVIILLLRPNDSLIHWLIGIIAAGMFFESFFVIDFWFQSQVQSKYAVWSKNVGFMIASYSRVLLIQAQAPLILFAWAYAAETALSAVWLVIAYRIKGFLLKAWQFSWSCAKELLKDSWTLILSSFVIMIYMRTDQLMLGQMIGDRSVGIYSAAVKVSELWYFVPMAITNSVFPAIVKAKRESTHLYYERIQKVLDFLAILSYAVAILLALLSNQFVTLLYGKSYVEAGAILTIHVWTGIFVSSGLVRGLWTTAENLMPFAFLTTATGAIVNIVLNYFLISRYKGMGAAISTLIAQVFASYVSNVFFSKTRIFFMNQTKAFMLINLLVKTSVFVNKFVRR
jgi:O-antigen/teichoic acid export membrane protein